MSRKLNENDVVKMSRMFPIASNAVIAEFFNVTPDHVRRIRNGELWRNKTLVTSEGFRKLTPHMLSQISDLIVDGLKDHEIAKKFGVDRSYIGKIRRGRNCFGYTHHPVDM